MNKIVTLNNGEEIYKVTIVILNKSNAEIWQAGEDTAIIVPIDNISTIT